MSIDDSGNNKLFSQRLLVATPTLGSVRIEWVNSRYNQIIPTNWSKCDLIQTMNSYIPLRYTIADAQNLAVKECLQKDFEWLLLIEDDTMPPVDAFKRFGDYMNDGTIPVVSGLYFTKSVPPEPLVYRGRGTSHFRGWKLEDKVWCDGVPTGMLLIHHDLLKVMWDDSPDYYIQHCNNVTRRVFDSPAQTWFNEEKGAHESMMGTSDLHWCTRVIKGGYLEKAGFHKVAKMKYPFLCDTNIYCRHIATDGTQFPLEFPKDLIAKDPQHYKGKNIKE